MVVLLIGLDRSELFFFCSILLFVFVVVGCCCFCFCCYCFVFQLFSVRYLHMCMVCVYSVYGRAFKLLYSYHILSYRILMCYPAPTYKESNFFIFGCVCFVKFFCVQIVGFFFFVRTCSIIWGGILMHSLIPTYITYTYNTTDRKSVV